VQREKELKALIIWDADYPWDVRIEKICNSFIRHGHTVHLVCRNRRQRPEYEMVNGLNIHRIPRWSGKCGGFPGFPFFLNPVWIWKIFSVAAKYKTDLILIRDLPLALSGIIVGKILRQTTFIDMAEPYPEMLDGYRKLQNQSAKKKFINTFARNVHLANCIESVACRWSSHIFPVSAEIMQKLIAKGIDREKITVFHNSPELPEDGHLMKEDIIKKRVVRDSDTLILLYVGDLTEARGVPVVIDALDKLKQNREKFKLVVVGSGRYEQELKNMTKTRNLEDDIIFTGWVPHDELASYFINADIGVIPHIPTLHNNLTIPNKIFDYMAFGLPIVTADLSPIRRILTETDSGLIADEFSGDAFAKTILKLKDRQLRQTMGRNGMQAVKNKYNWDNDFGIFLESVGGCLRQ
jgi:glycosyltransferase involved in cell wall biosynthesis